MPNSKTINPELTFNFILDKLSTFNFRHFKLLIIVLLTFNFILLTFNCSAQTYQWAKNGGSVNRDESNLICVDDEGNIYVAGRYYHQLGSPYIVPTYAVFSPDTVPVRGYSEIYLAKYSPSGNVLWAKSMGGNDPSFDEWEQPLSLIYDSVNNSILFTGSYRNTFYLGNDTLTVTGSQSCFMARFAKNGDVLLVKKLPSVTFIRATDPDGNIYVSSNTLLKYDSNGNLINSSQYGNWKALSVVIKNNHIYMLGQSFADTITVDSVEYNIGSSNNFVCRFDMQMNLQWIHFLTCSSNIDIPEMIADSSENLVIAGIFGGGDMQLDTTHFTATASFELFMASFDSSGTVRWAQTGESSDVAGQFGNINLALLTTGDFYISGTYYYGTQMKLCNNTVTGNTGFVAKYGMDGSCKGLKNGIYAIDLCVDTTNNIIIATSATSATLNTFSLTGYGSSDMLVVKYDGITGEELKNYYQNNQLLIYANPNAGKCTITIPTEFTTETKLTLQIFDTKGSLLQQTPVKMMQDKISVNITAEAKGVYTAVLSNGVKSYTGKIIFE